MNKCHDRYGRTWIARRRLSREHCINNCAVYAYWYSLSAREYRCTWCLMAISPELKRHVDQVRQHQLNPKLA